MTDETTPPTTEASEAEAGAANDDSILDDSSTCSDAVADARELAKEIHRSADALLERLLSHLSRLPEPPPTTTEEENPEEEVGGEGTFQSNDNNNNNNESEEDAAVLLRGVTLPVSAVAWLSGQLNALDELQEQHKSALEETTSSSACSEEITRGGHRDGCKHDIRPWLDIEEATSLRYRLNLLRFLLPRAQLIRLTRQSWPRQSSSSKNSAASFLCASPKLKKWWKRRRRRASGNENDDDDDDDDAEAPSENDANEFLRYARRFEHGAPNSVRLWRVFPNATVLILESVPPSWIDTTTTTTTTTGGRGGAEHTTKQPALKLISVTNAAIYELNDFLQSSTATTLSTTLPSSPFQSPVSHSLTHLKLDNCSLGELTTGFSSTLAKLVHLEYLSLRNNQFRSSKTLLRGLRPLTRLRYLDVSSNQLVGCFGPYANLCLGGQVKILKLSNNRLETCRNSGLEKCYALREVWLDSNHIKDVSEVSGLARLPDLQCLALQRNPFSTRKTSAALLAKAHSSTPQPLSARNHIGTNDHEFFQTTNPLYDPSWKIRLWTWFQHERRALTPLELPVLNKKTKHKGFHHSDCDAATIGRMTREEWDRIQQESYSVATTATVTTASSQSAPSVAQTTEEGLPKIEESDATAKTTSVAPIRNRRVTKKSKTRQAKIHSGNNTSRSDDIASPTNQTRDQKTKRGRRRRPKKGKQPLSEIAAQKNLHLIQRDGNGDGLNADLAGDDKLNASSNATSSSLAQNGSSSRDEIPTIDVTEVKIQHLSFSLQDVLVSLREEHVQQRQPADAECETLHDQEMGVGQDDQIKEPLSTNEGSGVGTADDDAPNNPFLDDDASQDEAEPKDDGTKETQDVLQDEVAPKDVGTKEIDDTKSDGQNGLTERNSDTNESKSPEPTPPQTEEVKSDNDDSIAKEDKEKSDESVDTKHSNSTNEASNVESAVSGTRSSPKRSPLKSLRKSPARPAAIDEDRIFVRPRVATVRLKRMGNHKPFDALKSDWDDVVKKAKEGKIPDGVLKPPVIQSSNDIVVNQDVFSDEAADLLGDAQNEPNKFAATKSVDEASASRSTRDPTVDPTVSSNNRAGSLPEQIWEDDDSVLSSLGASRDDAMPRRVNKFQLAEENCSYDGPESSRGMKVVENLQLYFETFVFKTSDIPLDVLDAMEEDEDDWQLITICHPRIQLWPDDRRVLELEFERSRLSSAMQSADWTTNRERFLRVWEEEIVPCGKPALRRLPPNRRNRLGFHGDKLFEKADIIDAYADCRKVLICLSSKAFYVIVEKDDVTKDHRRQAGTRRFPLPFDRGDRFRDAPWPHAVARHCLSELEAVCIGFEFQRLTLRFRNQSMPKSDPFVYVLLTGDKRETVRILQDIQKLAKDLADNNATSNIGTSSLANKPNSSAMDIENDSHIVFDSLNSLGEKMDSPAQTIGTVLHFQIVQQQWKHGDRGTVRRVCVITDTNILLLDEDYAADGHDLSSVTVKGNNMADVRYRLVDHAALSLVSQVQAAGSDPRAITIIIKPSTLSRTHRWRLICRNREGAERLVEDARKALEDL